MGAFWGIARIPSAKYPSPSIFWPAEAAIWSVWIRGRETGLFNVEHVLAAFAIGAAIYSIGFFGHLSISIVAVVAGANLAPHFALSYLISGVMALVLRKIFGSEFWNKHRYIMAGGIVLGEGIAVTLGVSMALIINSIRIMPW